MASVKVTHVQFQGDEMSKILYYYPSDESDQKKLQEKVENIYIFLTFIKKEQLHCNNCNKIFEKIISPPYRQSDLEKL